MRALIKSVVSASIGFVMLCAMTVVRASEPYGAGKHIPSADTTTHISILFRFDKSTIDSAFMDNARSLASLRRIMTDETLFSRIDSVIITGASSPDGNPQYNYRLSERRSNSLRSYIIDNYPALDASIISTVVNDKYWGGLIELVEDDHNVPARDDLLRMLTDPALSDNAKSRRMRQMNEGKTFAYLRDSLLLRRLRSTGATIEFRPAVVSFPTAPEPEPIVELIAEPVPAPVTEPESVVELTPQPESAPMMEPESVIAERAEIIEGPLIVTDVEEAPASAPEYIKIYPVALRTNLLLDIVGGANIGVEVPIGNHFSVAADFVHAYTRINNRYALQTIQGSVEGRYWFKPRGNRLTGWNVGVYGTYSSRYDIQWGGGYQGDGYWSAGLSGGYSWRLSDIFNLDLSAAAGVVWLPEIRYYDKPQDGHLMWTETRYNATRFLPTQVRVNFVWLIGAKKKVSK